MIMPFERNLVKERTPLAYEHIREDDATYMQRVWREIDVHEKMNLPFVYKAEGDNGNQRFIMILLNALKNDRLVAHSMQQLMTALLHLSPLKKSLNNWLVNQKSIQIPDWAKDPDGSKGIMKDTVISENLILIRSKDTG